MYENLYYTQIRINFAASLILFSVCIMNMIKLTAKEEELIAAIRNYRRGFPDSYPNLLYYAQQIFDELTDMP